jgi:hypothetical protein
MMEAFELCGIRTRVFAMRQLLERLRAIAQLATPVLIEGETGTGKELVARALHALSPRAGMPMAVVVCMPPFTGRRTAPARTCWTLREARKPWSRFLHVSCVGIILALGGCLQKMNYGYGECLEYKPSCFQGVRCCVKDEKGCTFCSCIVDGRYPTWCNMQ